MKYDDFAGDLCRNTALPAGWGTSPRRAPTAATYKPAHGGYPGEGEGMTTTNPWIKWGGGECPVPSDTIVEVKLRSGRFAKARYAIYFMWNHDAEIDGNDIVEYRTITEQPDLVDDDGLGTLLVGAMARDNLQRAWKRVKAKEQT